MGLGRVCVCEHAADVAWSCRCGSNVHIAVWPACCQLGALPSACCRHAGLPEEVSHTKQALARGYAVLAIDSRDRRWDSRCYS